MSTPPPTKNDSELIYGAPHGDVPDLLATRLLPPPRRFSRRLIWKLVIACGLALLATLAVGAHYALNRPPLAPLLENAARRAVSERFAGAQLTGHLSVSWLGTLSLGGFRLPGPTPDDPPSLAAERIVVHPSFWSLLRGRLRPKSLELRWVRLQTGPHASGIRTVIKQLAGHRAGKEPTSPGASNELPEVVVRDLFVDLPQSDTAAAPSAIGPLEVTAHWRRDEGALVFDLEGSLLDGHGGRFSLSGSASPARGELSLQGTLSALALHALPPELFTRGNLSLDDGSLSGEVTGTLIGKKLAARGSITLAQTNLRWDRLAADPVGPFDFSASGEVSADLGRHTVALHQIKVAANRADVLVDASFADNRAFEVEARLVRLDMQSAIDSLPRALRPPPQAPRVEGSLSGDLEVRGVFGKWDELQIQRADLDLGGLKQAAQRQEVSSFLERPFEFTPGNQEAPDRTFEVGPGNPRFTAIATLPAYVVRAIVLSEDAGFYGHHGFDFDEIKESISRDLAKGGAIRGGSTLTQQLVKNLFLSREKKLTRKIQEALITLEVEASLPKSRILELYLNTIEWGPRLYGLGEASDRYFGERPPELTPKQAAFLASIIPNPKKYYWYYSRGALTPNWEDRVGDILDKMEEVGVIDAAQRSAAEAPLEFHRTGAAPPQEAEPSPVESSDESDDEAH